MHDIELTARDHKDEWTKS